jgi:replicative DNA helicase
MQVENAVLGGVIRFPKVWDDLQLVAKYFDDALNQMIFERILSLRSSGVEPDVILVNAGLDGRGVDRVWECVGDAPLAAVAVKAHVNQLKAMWAKGELGLAGRKLDQGALDAGVDVSVLVAEALLVVDTVSASQAQLQISYPGEYLDEYVAEMQSRPPFMATCWKKLNKFIGGFGLQGFMLLLVALVRVRRLLLCSLLLSYLSRVSMFCILVWRCLLCSFSIGCWRSL